MQILITSYVTKITR